MCVSNDSFDFTLIVSLPDSSSYAQGMTVPIQSFEEYSNASPCIASTPRLSESTCIVIPTIVDSRGVLEVEAQVVDHVDAGAYIDTSVGSDWILPAHVQYVPLWPMTEPSTTDPAPTRVEAASVGLPLYPVSVSSSVPTNGYGPRGLPALEWQGPLAPTTYELDAFPDNQAFPVFTAPSFVPPLESTLSELPMSSVDSTAQAPNARTFTVTRPDGSLSGFTVYLRDATTLRRVSSLATLTTDAPGPITLATFNEPLAGGPHKLEVIVAPPEGSPIPYLADPVLLDHLGPTEPFPALPPTVTVSGTVVTPDLTPVQATLVIDSVAATGAVGGINTVNLADPAQPYMHYSTSAATDASGAYTVTLPPGTYDVFVTPAFGTSAGAGSVPLIVASPLGSEPPVAMGKDLQVPAFGILSGVAKLADGRPLIGATVQAQAAVSLAASVDPRRWPRTWTTTTDSNGVFAMSVDPGTYDVVVQPANGTGFPWTTVSSQVVEEAASVVISTVVPPPILIDLILQDPVYLQPLSQALVRAFAPASSAKSATPGAPLPMIEIGHWTTDVNGHVAMLIAPPH
jgi:hypothetical protein